MGVARTAPCGGRGPGGEHQRDQANRHVDVEHPTPAARKHCPLRPTEHLLDQPGLCGLRMPPRRYTAAAWRSAAHVGTAAVSALIHTNADRTIRNMPAPGERRQDRIPAGGHWSWALAVKTAAGPRRDG